MLGPLLASVLKSLGTVLSRVLTTSDTPPNVMELYILEVNLGS